MTPATPDVQALRRLLDGQSVLYAEDEPDIRTEMTEILQAVFSRVVAVPDGQQALERFGQEEFLLVVTDIHMPGLSGIELIRAVQQVRPQQSFLVTSAYSDAEHLVPLINLGVGSFLLKPLNWKVLLSLLYKEAAAALAERQEAQYQQKLEEEVRVRTEEVTEMQRQVLRLQEAKDNMLSLISHELRTPLNGILGFVELVRASEGVEAMTFLSLVEDSARRLERSTRKALDFANLSTGARSMNREWHSVEGLLITARDQVLDRQDGRAALRWEGAGGKVFTDGPLAVEMFRNLLENVLKYGDGTPVHLSFVEEGLWDTVVFRDEGPGFPAHLLPTLFQPFSTGNIMHHSEGMGLGLALVDVIMLTLGGRVEARNSSPGAELSLKFPRRPR